MISLYLADGGNREVLICDRKTGELVDQFGEEGRFEKQSRFRGPEPLLRSDGGRSDGSVARGQPGTPAGRNLLRPTAASDRRGASPG